MDCKFTLPLLFFLLLGFFPARAQYNTFTTGNLVRCGKNCHYYLYYVNGRPYKVYDSEDPYYTGSFGSMFPSNFLIGYDSLSPDRSKVFFDRPFFNPKDSDKIAPATGTVIFMRRDFVDYQYYVNKKNHEPATARQLISQEDTSRYHIRSGASYRVWYLKKDPAVAIIYFEDPLPGAVVDYHKPFLTRPNGISAEFGALCLNLDPSGINQYLHKYSRQSIWSTNPIFTFNTGQLFKSGINLQEGIGLGPGGSDANFFLWHGGFGYLRQINRRYYMNFSAQVAGYNLYLPSFRTDELARVTDSSEFKYTSWNINPSVELWRRKLQNNVWGTGFLKIGGGALINIPSNGKWKYLVGRDVVDSKGRHSIAYDFRSYLHDIPMMPRYLFYISVSYSFMGFFKQ